MLKCRGMPAAPRPAPLRSPVQFRSPRAAGWLLALCVAALVPSAARSQQTPLSAADSLREVRAVRSAQARFEYVRRKNLSWTWSPGTSECDERVGRFCLWHSDDDDAEVWQAPPEPEPVKAERRQLLDKLRTAAQRLPGDAWIAGQRVRYLAEAEQHADAVAAARTCRATRWWCLALEGYAHHLAQRFASADSAFAAALAAMSANERREWSDLSPLLDPGEAGRYRRARAAARDSLERRFWWLADPLFLTPGNERRTEHFARLVVDRLQERAKSAEAISWGNDLRELLLRYGWPIGWERIRPDHGRVTSGSASILTHYPSRSWHFLPPLRLATGPLQLQTDHWTGKEQRARTEYAPAYATRFEPLDHQLASFWRGDTAVVVAAFDLSRADSLPRDARVHSALFLAAEGAAPVAAHTDTAGLSGALTATLAAAPVLFSLEALVREERFAARARYGLRLAAPRKDSLALSGLLLVRPDSLPQTLAEAIPAALGSLQVRPGEQLGLFWEIYGAPGRSFSLAIQVERINVGAARRFAERIGLLEAAAPLRLEWSEEADAGSVLPRSLRVGLPELAAGDYRLTVRVRGEGATAASSQLLHVAP